MTKLISYKASPIPGSDPACTEFVLRYSGISVTVTCADSLMTVTCADNLGWAHIASVIRQSADTFHRKDDDRVAEFSAQRKPKGNKKRTGVLA